MHVLRVGVPGQSTWWKEQVRIFETDKLAIGVLSSIVKAQICIVNKIGIDFGELNPRSRRPRYHHLEARLSSIRPLKRLSARYYDPLAISPGVATRPSNDSPMKLFKTRNRHT